MPLLVLFGEADVWTPLAPCEAFLSAAKARGNPIELLVPHRRLQEPPVGPHRRPAPAHRQAGPLRRGHDRGKLAHLTWAVAIPLALNPWWGVLCFYLACSWATGFVLATTFQVAHCVDVADFVPSDEAHRGSAFQVHQLRTTVDIRCGFVAHGGRWLIGGLDHQVEHHLAPRLPHTIHPLLRRRVQSACSQDELPYRIHPSAWAALCSHSRWLKAMGQPPDDAAVLR